MLPKPSYKIAITTIGDKLQVPATIGNKLQAYSVEATSFAVHAGSKLQEENCKYNYWQPITTIGNKLQVSKILPNKKFDHQEQIFTGIKM